MGRQMKPLSWQRDARAVKLGPQVAIRMYQVDQMSVNLRSRP